MTGPSEGQDRSDERNQDEDTGDEEECWIHRSVAPIDRARASSSIPLSSARSSVPKPWSARRNRRNTAITTAAPSRSRPIGASLAAVARPPGGGVRRTQLP